MSNGTRITSARMTSVMRSQRRRRGGAGGLVEGGVAVTLVLDGIAGGVAVTAVDHDGCAGFEFIGKLHQGGNCIGGAARPRWSFTHSRKPISTPGASGGVRSMCPPSSFSSLPIE